MIDSIGLGWWWWSNSLIRVYDLRGVRGLGSVALGGRDRGFWGGAESEYAVKTAITLTATKLYALN